MKDRLKIKDFLLSNRLWILASSIMVIILWAPYAFSMNIGVDSDQFIVYPGTFQGWKGIGRYGIIIIKKLFGLSHYMPFFEGLLFLVTLFANILLWGLIFHIVTGKTTILNLILFSAVYVSSAVWMGSFYFAMMRAEVLMGMISVQAALLIVFVLFADSTGNHRTITIVTGLFLAVVFVIASISIYQSLVVYYITGAAGILLLFLLSEEHRESKKIIMLMLAFVAVLVCGFLLNQAIINVFFKSDMAYLNSKVLWGQKPIGECFRQLWLIVKIMSWGTNNRYSYTCLFGIVAIGIAIVLIGVITGKRKTTEKIFILISGFMFLVSPFILQAYALGEQSTRTHQALILAVSFGVYIILSVFEKRKVCLSGKILYCLAVIITVGFFYVQAMHTEVLIYTDNIRYEQEKIIAADLYLDIEEKQSEYPDRLLVVFAGAYDVPLNPACKSDDMIGRSVLSWDYIPGEPFSNDHRIRDFIMAEYGVNYGRGIKDLPEAQIQELEEFSRSMMAYPQKGYITEKDGFLIVKLSE